MVMTLLLLILTCLSPQLAFCLCAWSACVPRLSGVLVCRRFARWVQAAARF